MDPVTTAILAAAESPEDVASDYRALKIALRQKFGPDNDLVDAVENLEKKPESAGRRKVVQEEVVAAGADRDTDLLAAAQTVLEKVRKRVGLERPGFTPPLQRPARADSFTGREAELAQLLGKLQPERVIALCGPAGIGKSALAREAIWKLTSGNTLPAAFPAGIIYHNFYAQPRVDIALEQIARLWGEEPSPSPYEAVQRVLAKQPALLLLEAAEQSDDLAGMLTACGRSGLLITSRQDLPALAECREIKPLRIDQAVALLQSQAKNQVVSKTVARALCQLVDCLPLAVCLIGRYLAAQELEAPADFLGWLEQTPLANVASQERQQACVPLLIERSLTHVSQSAREALAVAGLLAPLPFDLDVVVQTLTLETSQGLLPAIRRIFKKKSDREIPNFRLVLRELVDYGLLLRAEDRYQVRHPLIHTYALNHLSAPGNAIRRLATYYMALTWEQTGLGPEGYSRLDLDRPHFMRILALCLEMEEWEASHGLAVAVEDYLDRRGLWSDRIAANETGLIAAWQLGRPSEGAWLGNLGDTYRTMGHAKWAVEHFEQALETARRTGDRHSEGNSLGNLGLAYRDLGQMDQAIQYLKESLAIFEAINSPRASLVHDWLVALTEEVKD